jgi:hypothetical protein
MELVLSYLGGEHLLYESDPTARQHSDTHYMVNQLVHTTAEFFPLRCRQKPDGVGDTRVGEYLRDQQEHLQSNIVEEEVSESTIGDEEPTRRPGNICSGETTRHSAVHINGGWVTRSTCSALL